MHYRGLFIGLTTIDIQYFVTEFPESNRKIKTNPPDILVGGPATNAAVAFAYLNNGAHVLTAVGNNSFTSFVEEDLKSNHIDFTDIIEGQNENPVVASVITSANGDRNIFTYNPSEIYSEINIEQLFARIKPQILLLDGFYPEFGLSCAKLARASGIPVVIDCGSWKMQYNELLKYTDVAICSADFFPLECKTHPDVFNYLEAKGVKKIAISRGEQNILFQEKGNRGEVTVENTSVVDTLGAGDFLHGAFCYYFVKNNYFVDALTKAAHTASFSCRFKGTREWLKK
ncbi:PfkB family carbohydrate kinase [Prolixibacteraceae bacterium Z1-6]|uniref:PfkB family carbohydrate kinase n=1 Tax=Draconibacterium aestuarii TaxID=2998507 RepID=A0A9X3F7V5_9BACT|nr:PfkB family carbohydrate kinase [Prolixibacteraceae bacterium Z1-6]